LEDNDELADRAIGYDWENNTGDSCKVVVPRLKKETL
jgi:hypothetical protein